MRYHCRICDGTFESNLDWANSCEVCGRDDLEPRLLENGAMELFAQTHMATSAPEEPKIDQEKARIDLSDLNTKQLKNLFDCSNTVKSLCVLWTVGICGMIFWLIRLLVSGRGSPPPAEIVALLLMVNVLAVFAVIGGFKRVTWGRVCGILLSCICLLSFFPYGTVIGFFGLIGYARGGQLWGPNAVSHKSLKQEVRHRKKNKVA